MYTRTEEGTRSLKIEYRVTNVCVPSTKGFDLLHPSPDFLQYIIFELLLTIFRYLEIGV